MQTPGDNTQVLLGQDNLSSIQHKTNGWKSYRKRSCHRNIRDFLVKDGVARGKIEIEYCPASEMVAHFESTPLRVALLRKFRDKIMSI